MAILHKNGNISGKVSNIVYRTWGGDTIIQSMPKKFKQTLSSIECSAEFGLASSTAAHIRHIFDPAFLCRDGKMVNRLNTKVLESLRASSEKACGERDLHDANLDSLIGFQFNNNSPLIDVLKIRPSCSFSEGAISVSIPPFNAEKALKGIPCSRYRLRLLVMALNFKEEFSQYIGHQDMEFLDKGDFKGAEWTFGDLPGGTILMASLSLHALTKNTLGEVQEHNSEKWCPAEIILAMHNPEIKEEKIEVERSERRVTNYSGNSILAGMQEFKEKLGKISSGTVRKKYKSTKMQSQIALLKMNNERKPFPK